MPPINKALSAASGAFQWKPTLSLRDIYNGVKGIYVSPSNGWQTSDFPPYAQDAKHGYMNGPAANYYDANLAADGGDRRWMDIQLPFTISPSMAQRLAKIQLLRNRYGGSGTFAFNLSMYRATALDIVQMTLPFFGWSKKLLEITAFRFTQAKQTTPDGQDVTLLGAEIDLQETDPRVYDWNYFEELTPQGYQQAVVPTMQSPLAPGDLVLLSDATTAVLGADGIARSRILATWTAPADAYVTSGGYVELQYQLVGGAWVGLAPVDPSVTSAYIDAVQDGQPYNVQIRSVNTAGYQSSWILAGPITASKTMSQINYSNLIGTPVYTVNGS